MRPLTRSALVFAVLVVVLSHAGRWFEPTPQRTRGARAGTGVMIVVDVSGSMAGEKIHRAQEALRSVAATLPPDTVVGLRTFSSRTRLVSAPAAGGGSGVEAAAAGLIADGGTEIGGALAAAGADIESAGGSQPWRIVLISDGEGNAPPRDLDAARELAARLPRVSCDTIGIEMNAKGERELADIAAILRGRSWMVGRDQLEATLSEVVSLSGVRSRRGTSGTDVRVAVIAVLLLALLVTGALRLRLHLSEAMFSMTLSAAAGTAAWLATQLMLPAAGTTLPWLALVQNVAYFMLAGGLLGVVLAMVEGVHLNEPRKAFEQVSLALPVGILGGAAAGLLGQALYALMGEAALSVWILRCGARAAGWAVAGALIGACPGVAASSRVRIQHGVIGGLAGGFAGGWLFEMLASSHGHGSRLVALISLSVAIGAMVRLVEQARKQAWLVLVVGGPEGKEFIVSKRETTLGSHYQDDVCVAGNRGYPTREAVIVQEGRSHWLETIQGGRAQVDGQPVAGRTLLRSGAAIRLGASELVFQLRDATGDEVVPRHQSKTSARYRKPDSRAAALRVMEQPEGIDWVDSTGDGDDAGIELFDVSLRPGAPPAA